MLSLQQVSLKEENEKASGEFLGETNAFFLAEKITLSWKRLFASLVICQ